MSEIDNTTALQTLVVEDVETEETETVEIDLEDVVAEVVEEGWEKGSETATPYRIAILINKVFQATYTEKQIPTQYMYSYDRNGIIVKGKKGVKAYTKDEVLAFVNKYTKKFVTI